MGRKEYDVAIIGGGPNGLICGAYLARTGLQVIILEARHETGGGLDTLEFAGFRYNLHAIYHMMAEYMPPFTDLSLGDKGVRYIFPEVQAAYLAPDREPIILYRDPEKTAQHLGAHFSAADGTAYRKMHADFKEFSEKILMPLTYLPPLPFIEQTQILNAARDDAGKRYNEIADLTPLDIIERYGFSDPVKAAILNLFTMWGLSPYEVGFIFPLYVYRMTDAALVAGGSHRLSSALYRTFIEAGGEVRDRATVVRVVMRKGSASGVILADGEEIAARAVASSVDPKQNFLDFFSEEEIPGDLIQSAQRWEWERASLFGVHLALQEAPSYIVEPDVSRALMTFLGISSTEQVLNHFDAVEKGNLPDEPLGHVTCTSIFDPLQAYGNMHTGRWESLAPFDADWEHIKDEYAAKCIGEWKRYAPNLEPINVLVYPPNYIEGKFKTMVRGSIKHGAYIALQMGYLRPNDRCSQGFTPIDGFYLCGSSAYPGGMILGGSGYLAANVIAEDFGVQKTWKEPPFLQEARERGFVVD